MTKSEAMRITRQQSTLMQLGFTMHEADALRRISMALRRWHELECGTGEGQVSISVERDEEDGKPYKRVQYPTANGYHDKRYPVRDMETGALRRLKAIIHARNIRQPLMESPLLDSYVQTDPRGAALYIIRPGDIPAGQSVDSCYSRGICVY